MTAAPARLPALETSPPRYAIAVRALCDFTARQGDLDLRFNPSPSAEEGMEGHRIVASRRGGAYRAEMRLQARHHDLLVRGRVDGYDPDARRLEEVKTHRGDLARLPENRRHLHWAQAKTYGWLLCRELELSALDIALVYFDVDTGAETPIVQTFSADALREFFERQCQGFLAWAEQESAHRVRRDAALSQLTWPLGDFRPGQRDLAAAVFNAARSRRCLLAQAPTGIGKTMGALFPMLKAMPGQALDKIFFLTAKSSGSRLAMGAAEQIHRHAPQTPLRVLALVARDKACEHPDKACHGESCPLARGFYDRLPAARQEAVGAGMPSGAALRELALRHQVCPYYLTQELVRWADLIVADCNYYFDLGAGLHILTLAGAWRVAVLADEAHNLVDRGRGMYSAELDHGGFQDARVRAPAALRRPLDKLHRQWLAMTRRQEASYLASDTPPPAAFLNALREASGAIGEHLAEQPEPAGHELLRFWFDALHFLKVLDLFDAHWQFDSTRPGAPQARRGRRTGATLCLRNLVPAPVLRERFAAVHTAVLFSATLNPFRYYTDVLGLPETTATLDIASAFDPSQLEVRVARHISTRYADRAASLDALVDLVADQYERAPANYIAFFSSFEYLRQASARLRERHPRIPLWEQAKGMTHAERDAFLERFQPDGQGVGFAVLGGVFGEGIDLPGSRLMGAFVATLGLPQLNAVNDALQARMQMLFGQGYRYAYLYPGLQKVVQAAGRVIRGPGDRGVVHLIDDRYMRRDVQQLLPAWWNLAAS